MIFFEKRMSIALKISSVTLKAKCEVMYVTQLNTLRPYTYMNVLYFIIILSYDKLCKHGKA